ncbi:MAG: hypothetical protein LIO71_03320 [Ruminococcus sp.]|nr:hypothetical protein [Ruminococcus sp.]
MADKMTKRDWFGEIRTIVEGSDYEDVAGALEFIDHQVELLDAKAVKAAERAAAKKADGDELRQTVLGILTEEAQTADDITAAIGDETITKAKVVARLTQLVKAGAATKEQVKTDDGRRVMEYKLCDISYAAEDAE